MYMGNIQGEYVKLEENKQIVMKWKMKDWESYSDTTLTFEEGDEVSRTTSTCSTNADLMLSL